MALSQGIANIPFGGGDGINDGSAAHGEPAPQHRRALSGDAGTYSTVAAIHDIPNPDAFNSAYKAKFGKDPGAYSAPAYAYACAQVFIQALKAAGNVSDMATLREDVRSYVANSANKYDTVLGSLGFDANGDTTQHTISYYKYDPTTKDWAFIKQRDFVADPIK